ncbi:MAG: protease SohB [Deltaproteobacteria bacterium]|nr:protease SohB [Deltaproteobacteria bacterium]
MDFLADYGLFLLETATVVVAALFVIGLIMRARLRSRGTAEHDGRLVIGELNRVYEAMGDALRRQTLPKPMRKLLTRQRKRERRARSGAAAQPGAPPRRRVFVLSFSGDMRASAVDSLRLEITAILAQATPGDEVVLRLESSGGMVHGYGLAASQLDRVKQAGLRLVVAIDKVAASGGYMMAAVADEIVAAPFAIVGSIGVVAAVPNFRRLLERHAIDVEHLTAGEYKRTLSMVGENTERGRAKFKEQLDETHGLFKSFLAAHRPKLDLDRVATGEHWYGTQALELGLVDSLGTSDDLLLRASAEADLYSVAWQRRMSVGDRLGQSVAAMLRGAVRGGEEALWQSGREQ